ncbi:MAG: bacillithiol biosynthesis BshC [Saprospiraceae bacterium]|nr:bacillithiol biosynthesis BshC [Saprospiraceae bacterium]
MQISKVSFENISALSYKDVFYQKHTKELDSFYAFEPNQAGLDQAIAKRSSYPVDRILLNSVLNEKYKKIKASDLQNYNVELLLQEKTFTVVTAHQPLILGGPAFYFYKICSIINLCKSLKRTHPDFNFIPVFVTGSEDHDFDEIKGIQLFGKSLEWQTEEKGPVGRFSTEGISEIIQQVSLIMGSTESALKLINIFNDSLRDSEIYNDFVFNWINAIFGQYGLLVFNMDDDRIKRSFIPMMQLEITERISEKLVVDTQQNFYISISNLRHLQGM